MRLYIALLVGVFLFFSCKEEIKSGLSDEKMVNVLTDLHLAEASMLTLNKRLKDSIHVVYYEQVFKIHEVNDSLFFEELEILRKSPKRVEEIYTKVIDNIEQLDLKEEETDPKKKK